jgi:hypothetical protein
MRALSRLPWPLVILWCYVGWWAVMVGCHFDPDPRLWLTAVGIAVIVGIALVLATWPPGVPLGWQPRLVSWSTARLFLMPLGVSSFSATSKGQGFVLIFSPHAAENLLALAVVAGVVALRLLAGWLVARSAPDTEPLERSRNRTEGQAPA